MFFLLVLLGFVCFDFVWVGVFCLVGGAFLFVVVFLFFLNYAISLRFHCFLAPKELM